MAVVSSASQAQQVRDWVDALPEGQPFRLHEVPVPAKTAKVEMSRLAADPDTSGVKRLVRGTYLKGRRVPEIGDLEAKRPLVWSFLPVNPYLLVLWYVGSGRGLGYTRMHALHKAGWVDQVPIKTDVAVAGRPPPSPMPELITIVGRPNMRRLALSGAEVSILEAARFSWFLNDEDLLPRLKSTTKNVPASPVAGLAHSLPPWDYVLRPDRLKWAVEAEHCKNAAEVRERVQRFADMLPGDLCYQRHWPRAHLLDA